LLTFLSLLFFLLWAYLSLTAIFFSFPKRDRKKRREEINGRIERRAEEQVIEEFLQSYRQE
jgi:hypothetical protein